MVDGEKVPLELEVSLKFQTPWIMCHYYNKFLLLAAYLSVSSAKQGRNSVCCCDARNGGIVHNLLEVKAMIEADEES